MDATLLFQKDQAKQGLLLIFYLACTAMEFFRRRIVEACELRERESGENYEPRKTMSISRALLESACLQVMRKRGQRM